MSSDDQNGEKPRRNALGQFVPGSSGNPRGPRAKPRRLEVPGQIGRDILALAQEVVEVGGPHGRRKVAKGQLIIDAIYANAMKGRVGAQKLFVDLMKMAQVERLARHPNLELGEMFRQLYEDPNGVRDPAFLSALDEWIRRAKRLQ